MIADVLQAVMFGAWLIVLCAAEIFDALCTGLETGIYVLNKHRLDLHAESGRPPAVQLRRMLAEPDRVLATLLLGTNVGRYAATFAISAMFVLTGHEHRADLRDAVEGLQEPVAVVPQVGNPVALLHPQTEQTVGKAMDAFPVLGIGEPVVSAYHAGLVSAELESPFQESHRSQRYVHRVRLLQS